MENQAGFREALGDLLAIADASLAADLSGTDPQLFFRVGSVGKSSGSWCTVILN